MSLEDYSGLFTATKQWVESKRKDMTKRNFPNSVAEMKVRVQMCWAMEKQPTLFFTPTRSNNNNNNTQMAAIAPEP